jgi:hypothetical protein
MVRRNANALGINEQHKVIAVNIVCPIGESGAHGSSKNCAPNWNLLLRIPKRLPRQLGDINGNLSAQPQSRWCVFLEYLILIEFH